QRAIFMQQPEHRVDELLALVVLQLAQRDVAAQMVAAVRIAAGTSKRALARDLDREIRLVARQNLAPRPQQTFHASPRRCDCAAAERTLYQISPATPQRFHRTGIIAM